MKNTLLKQFSKLDFVFILIFSVLISLLFICRGNSYINRYYDLKNFYEDINYDFSVPAPSYDQLDEITKDSIVDIKTTPYFVINSSIFNNTINQKCNIYVLREKDCNFLPYKGISFPKNGGIISRSLASKLEANVGDVVFFKIKNNKILMHILNIIENTYEYNSVVDFCLIDESLISNFSSDVPYSGAWIKTDDILNTRSFLNNNYKPWGKLYKQSDYDSVEQYEMHKKTISEGDYSKEILDIEQMKLDVFHEEGDLLNKGLILTVLGIMLLIMCSVLPTIVEVFILNGVIVKRILNDGISRRIVRQMVNRVLLVHFSVSFAASLLVLIYHIINHCQNCKFLILTYILFVFCWYIIKSICQFCIVSKIFKTDGKNNKFITN